MTQVQYEEVVDKAIADYKAEIAAYIQEKLDNIDTYFDTPRPRGNGKSTLRTFEDIRNIGRKEELLQIKNFIGG